jgi:hypothetical protein
MEYCPTSTHQLAIHYHLIAFEILSPVISNPIEDVAIMAGGIGTTVEGDLDREVPQTQLVLDQTTLSSGGIAISQCHQPIPDQDTEES